MSGDQTWPLTVDRVVYDTKGRFVAILVQESIGEELTSKLFFPHGWRGYDNWDNQRQNMFRRMLTSDRNIIVTFDADYILMVISDTYSSFIIEEAFDMPVSDTTRTTDTTSTTMSSSSSRSGGALSLQVTLKNGSSTYTKEVQIGPSVLLSTRDYLCRLRDCEQGGDLILSAMIKECDRHSSSI